MLGKCVLGGAGRMVEARAKEAVPGVVAVVPAECARLSMVPIFSPLLLSSGVKVKVPYRFSITIALT